MANKYVGWWKESAVEQPPKVFGNPERCPGQRSLVAPTEASSVIRNYRRERTYGAPHLPPSLHRAGKVGFEYHDGHSMPSDSGVEAMVADIDQARGHNNFSAA
jgi:hypothetical protein